MKKIIIVCEENLRVFGDFLAQLLSLNDDEHDEIIGVKDGAAVAQVWTEKEYESNAIQISSEQYILFIGKSALMEDKRRHMLIKHNQHGMQYGWLGKQATLFVSEIVPLEEYDVFLNKAKKIQPEISKLIEVKSNKHTEKEVIELSENADKKGLNRFLNPFKKIPDALSLLQNQSKMTFLKFTNRKKIEEQMYSYLILLFYLQGMSDFLGLNED